MQQVIGRDGKETTGSSCVSSDVSLTGEEREASFQAFDRAKLPNRLPVAALLRTSNEVYHYNIGSNKVYTLQ